MSGLVMVWDPRDFTVPDRYEVREDFPDCPDWCDKQATGCWMVDLGTVWSGTHIRTFPLGVQVYTIGNFDTSSGIYVERIRAIDAEAAMDADAIDLVELDETWAVRMATELTQAAAFLRTIGGFRREDVD